MTWKPVDRETMTAAYREAEHKAMLDDRRYIRFLECIVAGMVLAFLVLIVVEVTL